MTTVGGVLGGVEADQLPKTAVLRVSVFFFVSECLVVRWFPLTAAWTGQV